MNKMIPSARPIRCRIQICDNDKSRIGAMSETIKSICNIFEKGSGRMQAEIQRIIRIFKMLDPIIFPIVIFVFFLNVATIDVTSSGVEVPIAMIVSPIIASDNPNIFAICTDQSTSIFPQKKRANIHHPMNNRSFLVECVTSSSIISVVSMTFPRIL